MSRSVVFNRPVSIRFGTFRGFMVLAFALAIIAAPRSANADIYVLKQQTVNGRVYFVDAVRDNHLIFKAVHNETYTEESRISLDQYNALSELEKLEYIDVNKYSKSREKMKMTRGPESCELRSNAAVRVVGDDLAHSIAAFGKNSPMWKDRRGFLHSVDFLARQLRYNNWNRLSGVQAPQIPLSGIFDPRTLRIDSEMMHHRLDAAEQNLRLQGAQTALRSACLELGGDGADCDASRDPRITDVPQARLSIGAARAALARYDGALNSVRLVTPKPIDLPIFNENDNERKKSKFEKKLEKSNFRRLYDSDGMNLGKIECDFLPAEFPPTTGEPEDGVTEQVDSLSFDSDQERALSQLKDEAQRLIKLVLPVSDGGSR